MCVISEFLAWHFMQHQNKHYRKFENKIQIKNTNIFSFIFQTFFQTISSGFFARRCLSDPKSRQKHSFSLRISKFLKLQFKISSGEFLKPTNLVENKRKVEIKKLKQLKRNIVYCYFFLDTVQNWWKKREEIHADIQTRSLSMNNF